MRADAAAELKAAASALLASSEFRWEVVCQPRTQYINCITGRTGKQGCTLATVSREFLRRGKDPVPKGDVPIVLQGDRSVVKLDGEWLTPTEILRLDRPVSAPPAFPRAGLLGPSSHIVVSKGEGRLCLPTPSRLPPALLADAAIERIRMGVYIADIPAYAVSELFESNIALPSLLSVPPGGQIPERYRTRYLNGSGTASFKVSAGAICAYEVRLQATRVINAPDGRGERPVNRVITTTITGAGATRFDPPREALDKLDQFP